MRLSIINYVRAGKIQQVNRGHKGQGCGDSPQGVLRGAVWLACPRRCTSGLGLGPAHPRSGHRKAPHGPLGRICLANGTGRDGLRRVRDTPPLFLCGLAQTQLPSLLQKRRNRQNRNISKLKVRKLMVIFVSQIFAVSFGSQMVFQSKEWMF